MRQRQEECNCPQILRNTFDKLICNIKKSVTKFQSKIECPRWTKNRWTEIALNKKGRFCNNIEIYTLISKRLSIESQAKLSQLETQNTSLEFALCYSISIR